MEEVWLTTAGADTGVGVGPRLDAICHGADAVPVGFDGGRWLLLMAYVEGR